MINSALNKRVAIIAGDLEGLNEIISQENGLVQALEKLEVERLSNQAGLVERLGVHQDVSANELIETMRVLEVESWIES